MLTVMRSERRSADRNRENRKTRVEDERDRNEGECDGEANKPADTMQPPRSDDVVAHDVSQYESRVAEAFFSRLHDRLKRTLFRNVVRKKGERFRMVVPPSGRHADEENLGRDGDRRNEKHHARRDREPQRAFDRFVFDHGE